MGSLAFDDFKAQLLLRMGNRTQLQSVSSIDYYGVWINQAYKRLTCSARVPLVGKSVYFPELQTKTTTGTSTSNGVAYITTPSDAIFVKHVYNTTSTKKLSWIPLAQYVEKTDRADAGAEAAPTRWHRHGNYIYLHPTPDATYVLEVWYQKRPLDLQGEEVTVIGEEWDYPILCLAAYYAHQWMGEYERSKAIREEYADAVGGVIGIYAREEKDRNENLRPDDAYYPSRGE